MKNTVRILNNSVIMCIKISVFPEYSEGRLVLPVIRSERVSCIKKVSQMIYFRLVPCPYHHTLQG